MTLTEAMARIDRAGSFAELLDRGESAETAYRKWAKLVHPDAAGDNAAFAKLSLLFEKRSIAEGDIADLFAQGDDALMKVPRSPGDNDLMADEADALRTLHSAGDPQYRAYAPKLIDSYLHENAARERRRINVLERLDGFVPLSAITRELDPRDAAWMWRRLLVGLGWAHRTGVVHGAVIEEHVLIHPVGHGVVLVDWCYSSPYPKAIVKKRADAYPPEVRAKQEISPATDIYMATGLMARLIGSNLPRPLRNFVKGCLYDAPRMRPQDAWALLEELDELLHSLYGPRTFRPFTL